MQHIYSYIYIYIYTYIHIDIDICIYRRYIMHKYRTFCDKLTLLDSLDSWLLLWLKFSIISRIFFKQQSQFSFSPIKRLSKLFSILVEDIFLTFVTNQQTNKLLVGEMKLFVIPLNEEGLYLSYYNNTKQNTFCK